MDRTAGENQIKKIKNLVYGFNNELLKHFIRRFWHSSAKHPFFYKSFIPNPITLFGEVVIFIRLSFLSSANSFHYT